MGRNACSSSWSGRIHISPRYCGFALSDLCEYFPSQPHISLYIKIFVDCLGITNRFISSMSNSLMNKLWNSFFLRALTDSYLSVWINVVKTIQPCFPPVDEERGSYTQSAQCFHRSSVFFCCEYRATAINTLRHCSYYWNYTHPHKNRRFMWTTDITVNK